MRPKRGSSGARGTTAAVKMDGQEEPIMCEEMLERRSRTTEEEEDGAEAAAGAAGVVEEVVGWGCGGGAMAAAFLRGITGRLGRPGRLLLTPLLVAGAGEARLRRGLGKTTGTDQVRWEG